MTAVALVEEHLRHRIADAVAVGGDDRDATLREVVRTFERLVRI